MKRLLGFVGALSIAVLCIFVAHQADAADIWVGQLLSSDAGPTNTITVPNRVNYTLQCTLPGCYATGKAGATLSTVCNQVDAGPQGFQLLGAGGGAGIETVSGTSNLLAFGGSDGGLSNVYQTITPAFYTRSFAMGSQGSIVAAANDGGAQACQVFQSTTNPGVYVGGNGG